MRATIVLSIATLSLMASPTARSALVTYTDSAAFDAATSSLTLSTENFSTTSPGVLSKGTSLDFGGFSARADDVPGNNMVFYVAPSPFSGAEFDPFRTSQHLGWAENAPGIGGGSGNFGPTITITFDTPQTAVSFLFLDSDSTDEYILSVDGQALTGLGITPFPSTNSTYQGSFFYGIVDTSGTFSTLTFSTPTTNPGGTVEEFGRDNLRFSPTPVPEPPSGLIALGGAACLGLALSCRQRARQCQARRVSCAS